MLTRTLDLLKRQGSTLLLTGLTSGPGVTEETEMEVSSLIDTWIALDVERTPLSSRRTLYIVKTRGMEHSQDTRQFLMSSTGLSLRAIAGADRGTGGKS
jgi:circadian clock protein KaiC